MKRHLCWLLLAFASAFAATPVAAQSCAFNANPFTDVGAGEFFCSDALWLRNAA